MKQIGFIRPAALPLLAVLSLGASLAAHAQEKPKYQRFQVEVTGSAFRPTGKMVDWRLINSNGSDRPLFSSTPGFGFSFGYRPFRYLQVDGGGDFGGGVAGVERTITVVPVNGSGSSSTRTVRDHLVVAPFGARFILPLMGDRLLFSVGGGGAAIADKESAGGNVTCTSCRSRTGFGSYGLAQAMWYGGTGKHLGVGFTARYLQARLSPGWLQNYPASGTRDRYLQLGGTVAFRF
jgi:hypothetical protein